MVQHITKDCDIRACINEATNWIEDKHSKDETFYLCEDHAYELSNEDEEIKILDLITGEIETKEVAVYSCSDECIECNN